MADETSKEPQIQRNLLVEKSPSDLEFPVSELHGKRSDKYSEDWLVSVCNTFPLPRNANTYSAATAFARSSTCCMFGCSRFVEVGAHVTMDGDRLWIIPTCKAHNAVGALDKLGTNSRMKRNTVYLSISMPKKNRIQEEKGKFNYDIDVSPEMILKSANILDTVEEDDVGY